MFESLPGHALHLPEFRPAPIPARPVIPWAAYAADFSKTLSQVLENLSPEERQRKKLELSLLGAKTREASMQDELTALQLQAYKSATHGAASSVNNQNSIFTNKVGGKVPEDSHSFEGGPPNDPIDTAPHDYYGYATQDGGDTEAP